MFRAMRPFASAIVIALASSAAASVTRVDLSSGQGDWRYRFDPERTVLTDADSLVQDGHGLAKDRAGNIYYTFNPREHTPTSQVLVRFSPDGRNPTWLGEMGEGGLSRGIPHGLQIEYDPIDEREYLYHSNNDATVIKTTLDGEILWRANFSGWQTARPHYWPFKPCDAVVVPASDVLLVTDGYGSSYVHSLNKTTGAYLEGRSFGGKGRSSADPVRLDTPHAIALDPRRPGTFAISDRSNHRLVWVTASGHFVAEALTASPAGMSLPCNVDVRADEAVGDVALVPSLGLSYNNLNNGSVAIYDEGHTVLSVIEVAATVGHLGHQHPHDAIFLPNGDVVIACWSGPSNGPEQGPAKGTIGYWQRLPARDARRSKPQASSQR